MEKKNDQKFGHGRITVAQIAALEKLVEKREKMGGLDEPRKDR
jgi:hypothetical protein